MPCPWIVLNLDSSHEGVTDTHPSVPGCRREVRSLPSGLLFVPLGQLPEEAAESDVGGLGRGRLLLGLQEEIVTQFCYTILLERVRFSYQFIPML